MKTALRSSRRSTVSQRLKRGVAAPIVTRVEAETLVANGWSDYNWGAGPSGNHTAWESGLGGILTYNFTVPAGKIGSVNLVAYHQSGGIPQTNLDGAGWVDRPNDASGFFKSMYVSDFLLPGAHTLQVRRRSDIAVPVHLDYFELTTFAAQEYAYTGTPQSIVVPAGAKRMIVDFYGAQGADYPYSGGKAGGKGGRVQSAIPVTPGEVLQLRVGGAGVMVETGTASAAGYNGGGDANNSGGNKYALGGGGATDIRRGAFALADRLVVAGGGGGAASSASLAVEGGDGGGLVGEAGIDAGTGRAGGAGTQSAGGAAGSPNGTAGTLGAGGNAQYNGWGMPGAGGGGYYGGGSGGGVGTDAHGGPGGGGSSYTVPSAVNVVHTQGARSGHGLAVIAFSTVDVVHERLVKSLGATSMWKLDEASGTVAADSIGTKHGTYRSNTTKQQTVGAFKGAGFDGSVASGIDLPAWGDVGNDGFTLETIIQTSDASAGPYLMSTRDPSNYLGEIILALRPDGRFWILGYGTDNAQDFAIDEATGASLADGQPHHIVLSKAPTLATVIVDGVQRVTAAASSKSYAQLQGALGYDRRTVGSPLNGKMARCTFYPTALSVAQARALATAVDLAATPPVGAAPGAVTSAVNRGSGTSAAIMNSVQAAVAAPSGGPGSTLVAYILVSDQVGGEAPATAALTGVGTVWTKRHEQHTWESSNSHKLLVYTCNDAPAGVAGTLVATFGSTVRRHAILIVDEVIDGDTYIQGNGTPMPANGVSDLTTAPQAGNLQVGILWNTSGSYPSVTSPAVQIGQYNVHTPEGYDISAITAYRTDVTDGINYPNQTGGERGWFIAEFGNDL